MLMLWLSMLAVSGICLGTAGLLAVGLFVKVKFASKHKHKWGHHVYG